MASTPTSLIFKVHRREPELIIPASPTPYEFKPLSDIDDQGSLRFQIPVMQFYRHDPSMQGRDPAKVIKEALAKTLVFYYPLAGRLREGPNGKLAVECTGEGILFIEADADVALEQFGDALQPPIPCFDELLFDVPGSSGVLNCPLLLIQVTRLNCGGFILALRINHTISDGPGLFQFLSAVAQMARGESVPSILPVWERHLLNARNPPRVTCIHRAYEEVEDTMGTTIPLDDMTLRSFFFGPTEISRLRKFAPSHLGKYTTFEILTAHVWRCRTIALQPDPSEEMRMICLVNIRNKTHCPLPKGYYGNGFALSAAVSTARDLIRKPFAYALELIKKAKRDVTMEHMQSVADLMVIKGRPLFTAAGSFLVSDLTQAGLEDVDYGWGKAAYGGPTMGGGAHWVISFYIPFKNMKGDNGIVLPIYLPAQAMGRFVKEVDKILEDQPNVDVKSRL